MRLLPVINRYFVKLQSMSENFIKCRDEIVNVITNICKENKSIPKSDAVLKPFIESLLGDIIGRILNMEDVCLSITPDEKEDICLEILSFCIDDIIFRIK